MLAYCRHNGINARHARNNGMDKAVGDGSVWLREYLPARICRHAPVEGILAAPTMNRDWRINTG